MGERREAQAYRDAPTRTIAAAGAVFAYRELGPQAGVPLVVLTHLGANLDGWDPRIVDGLAQARRVIAVGCRGVGDSTGRVLETTRVTVATVLGAVLTFHDPKALLFFTSTLAGRTLRVSPLRR